MLRMLEELLPTSSQGRGCGDRTNHAGFVAGLPRLPSLRGQLNKGEALLHHAACLQMRTLPWGSLLGGDSLPSPHGGGAQGS